MDKEYYINLIKKTAKHIENHAEAYLDDINDRLKSLHFEFDIEAEGVPEIRLTKSYIPEKLFEND